MKVLSVALLFLSMSTFASTSFTCIEDHSKSKIKLTVDAEKIEVVKIGDEISIMPVFELWREISYIPGNNNKRYYKYTDGYTDALIPTVMAHNKVNQGVVLFYYPVGKTKFNCFK